MLRETFIRFQFFEFFLNASVYIVSNPGKSSGGDDGSVAVAAGAAVAAVVVVVLLVVAVIYFRRRLIRVYLSVNVSVELFIMEQHWLIIE
jgi:hypothetical protein